MSIVRWGRREAIGADPLAVDELDGAAMLVIDDVTALDDAQLAWCRRAPCVVVAVADVVSDASRAVDVTIDSGMPTELAVLERLEARACVYPNACRALVDVLRAVPALDVAAALVLESLAYSMLLAGTEFAEWLANRVPRTRHDGDGPAVRLGRDGDSLRVTLARPENRNAFSAEMRDALFETLTAAEIDTSLAEIVVDADGPSFSSGGDLTEFGTADDVVRAHQIRTLRSVGAVLSRLAPSVTAIVQGPCIGAGVELSAFAGHVVARPGATFRLPEIEMGLIPGAGGTVSISRRIGVQATARFALLGEAITADAALALGLVDELA